MTHAELVELAKTAFKVHRISVGGGAEDGTPIPEWDGLDETTRSAWIGAASEAAAEFLAEQTVV
jgi:hypothetical protein